MIRLDKAGKKQNNLTNNSITSVCSTIFSPRNGSFTDFLWGRPIFQIHSELGKQTRNRPQTKFISAENNAATNNLQSEFFRNWRRSTRICARRCPRLSSRGQKWSPLGWVDEISNQLSSWKFATRINFNPDWRRVTRKGHDIFISSFRLAQIKQSKVRKTLQIKVAFSNQISFIARCLNSPSTYN